MAKHIYQVTLPVAGHMVIDVEADSEQAAIDKALEEATIDHIETWEPLERFHEGNFCYCPSPWEAEVVDCGPDEDGSAA